MRAFADDGLDVVMVRPFNHTGPRQPPAFVAPSMARQIALIERGRAEPVIRVGNLDARRDFTDVRDVVRAYVALAGRSARPARSTTSARASDAASSRCSTRSLSRSRVEVRVEVDPERLRPTETSALVADTTPASRPDTGWQPQISFESMLDHLLEYWRAEVQRAK